MLKWQKDYYDKKIECCAERYRTILICVLWIRKGRAICMSYIIAISNLQKSYGQKQVLSNVSFCVNSGEIFGLLGPSGSGKTTLINILTGQLKKDEGNVLIFGQQIEKVSDEQYIQVGMVMDQVGLINELTSYQNLAVFADIYNVDKKRIDGLLDSVGLLSAKKTLAGKLSKGMRQRLAFARAILHDPKILFFDEPTSALDPLNTIEIHKLILQLKNQGKTIFLTTHKMDEAMKLCDSIAILNKGTIVEYGIPSEICSRYNRKRSITITYQDGSVDNVDNDVFKEFSFSDKKILTIHSNEPKLEDVYMEILRGGGVDET